MSIVAFGDIVEINGEEAVVTAVEQDEKEAKHINVKIRILSLGENYKKEFWVRQDTLTVV